MARSAKVGTGPVIRNTKTGNSFLASSSRGGLRLKAADGGKAATTLTAKQTPRVLSALRQGNVSRGRRIGGGRVGGFTSGIGSAGSRSVAAKSKAGATSSSDG